MELSELAAYAENRYHIREERQWKDHSNFSVLVHPMTGKWIAILMREWNSITGEQLERCDIKAADRRFLWQRRICGNLFA